MSRLCHDSMTRVSRGTCAAPAAAGPRLSPGGGWPRPGQCQAQHSAHWAVAHTTTERNWLLQNTHLYTPALTHERPMSPGRLDNMHHPWHTFFIIFFHRSYFIFFMFGMLVYDEKCICYDVD